MTCLDQECTRGYLGVLDQTLPVPVNNTLRTRLQFQGKARINKNISEPFISPGVADATL